MTAKPHGVRTSFSPLGSGKMVSSQNQRKSLSSPEPMSIGGDSERSRSPSPVEAGVELPVTADQLPVPVVQLPRYSYGYFHFDVKVTNISLPIRILDKV